MVEKPNIGCHAVAFQARTLFHLLFDAVSQKVIMSPRHGSKLGPETGEGEVGRSLTITLKSWKSVNMFFNFAFE